MSEMVMTMGSTSMYEEVEEIRKLNKVDGFDPRKYMRVIQQEGQSGKYYLDVAFRKLWFRLKYPEGKIVKKILKLTEQVAIVEARVYLNRSDSEDNYISNALAQKYMTADGQFGNKFVELAETAAVGRALSDAGFGLQFADWEGDADPEVTEAPFDPRMIAGMGGAVQESTAGGGKIIQDENLPGQYEIGEYILMPEEVEQTVGMTPAMRQAGTAPAAMGQAVQSKSPAALQGGQVRNPAPNSAVSENTGRPAAQKAENTAAAKGSNAQGVGEIRKDMPVEQIYSMLNRDRAAAVVIPMGFNKGKTLGQVAVEKPANLQWYVDSYGGPDNLLRAAAKFLIDAALAQAS